MTAQGRSETSCSCLHSCCLRRSLSDRHPGLFLSQLSTRPAPPLFTLRLRLWADGAKLGARMGHYSFPVRLLHSLHHAGLSRRTTKPIQVRVRPTSGVFWETKKRTPGLARGCRVEKRRAMCRSIGFQCIRPFELCGREPPDHAYVSSSPSKIPYGGFSPVRLQTGYQPWRPSPAGCSAVSARHASAPKYRQLIRHHSPSAGSPMVLSDKITESVARTLQSSGPWLASGL